MGGREMNEAYREKIMQRIEALTPDARFNLRDLLGDEWPEQSGEARQLGRDFKNQLNDFEGVAYEERVSANLSWYRKQ